jgi:hypothetical protein
MKLIILPITHDMAALEGYMAKGSSMGRRYHHSIEHEWRFEGRW